MSSSSGIRAGNGGLGDYSRKIVLKDRSSYGPWRAKMTSILDAKDYWDIVNGDEGELALVEPRTAERVFVNQEEVTEGRKSMKRLSETKEESSVLNHLDRR